MGIPAYFSQIIKNYPDIFIDLTNNQLNIDNLYLDSNGIVYDCINYCKESNNFETDLCNKVCDQICNYINLFNPQKKIIIAFEEISFLDEFLVLPTPPTLTLPSLQNNQFSFIFF